jgi:hypothetical protein
MMSIYAPQPQFLSDYSGCYYTTLYRLAAIESMQCLANVSVLSVEAELAAKL